MKWRKKVGVWSIRILLDINRNTNQVAHEFVQLSIFLSTEEEWANGLSDFINQKTYYHLIIKFISHLIKHITHFHNIYYPTFFFEVLFLKCEMRTDDTETWSSVPWIHKKLSPTWGLYTYIYIVILRFIRRDQKLHDKLST